MVLINYVLMCLIFGTTFLAIKIGVDAGAPPFFSAGIRFFLAGALIYIWMLVKGKVGLFLLLRKELMIIGFLMTFGTFATLYWSEQYVSSGIAAVLSATGPIIVIILQGAVFKQKSPWITKLGCLVGFSGVALLLLPNVYLEFDLRWILSCLLILLGVLSYTSGTLYSKTVFQVINNTSPIALNAVQMIYGGIMLLLLSCVFEAIDTWTIVLYPSALGSLAYLMIIGSMLGHTLFYWLVSKTNPLFPSTWLFVSPIIAVAIGIVLYNEPFSGYVGWGVAGVLGGLYLVNYRTFQALFKSLKFNSLSKKNQIIFTKTKTSVNVWVEEKTNMDRG